MELGLIGHVHLVAVHQLILVDILWIVHFDGGFGEELKMGISRVVLDASLWQFDGLVEEVLEHD